MRAMILALLAAMPLAAMGQGPWIKLSGGQSFSDVKTFQISPLGDRVIYRHDANVDDAFELWSVPIKGGAPVRLSGLLPSGSQVHSFELTADGSRVVYVAPQEIVGLNELYIVPATGGAPLKLSGTTVSDPSYFGVFDFKISPDGSRVVFHVDQGPLQIYSVPITGGTPVRLNDNLVPGGIVTGFVLAPIGTYVVYQADQDVNGRFEIYSVPIDGGFPIKLNSALPVGGDAGIPEIAATNPNRVVYRADQRTNDVFELYSVPIVGGTPTQLNGALVSGGVVDGFQIAPPGGRVVYLADQQTDDSYELYSVPISGGPAVKLNGPLVAGGGVLNDFQISSRGGNYVVYRAAQETVGTVELYSVGIAGNRPSIKLNGDLVAGGDVLDFKLDPQARWVVYRADETLDGLPLTYRAPIAGPAGSGTLISQTPVIFSRDYQIGPSGDDVYLRGGVFFVDSVERLWRVPLSGTPNPAGVELVPKAAFDPDGDVSFFSIGPDGSVVYIADQDSDTIDELYAIPAMIFGDGFE